MSSSSGIIVPGQRRQQQQLRSGLDAPALTAEDIEAQIRDIQSRKKELIEEGSEKDRVGLGESGYYDRDIYDGGGSKFDGYVTSIAANDEVEDEDYDIVSFSQNKRTGYTAPAALLNDVAQSEKDYDPFADRRRPTIAEKEDEYRQKRRRMIISPERVDPFAEGQRSLSDVLQDSGNSQACWLSNKPEPHCNKVEGIDS